MGRPDYGRLGGRRSGSAVWQWVIIGITLGFACAAVVVLTLLTIGILNIDDGTTTVAQDVTNTPFVITASPDPLQPTQAPIIITATVAPTEDVPVEQVQVQPPTPTTPPTEDPNPEPQVSETPTEAPTEVTSQSVNESGGTTTESTNNTTTGGETTNLGAEGGSSIPALLQPFVDASDLVPIEGGTFQMGTSPQEVRIAVDECTTRDGGACQIEYGQDSIPAHAVTIDPFLIERTEVTNAEYVAFLNSLGAGSHLNGCGGFQCIATQRENEFSYIVFDSANYSVAEIFANFPASGVTWYGARAFCQAIDRRLPTEAEWERAARGPNNFLYPWGDTWNRELARVRVPAEQNDGDGAGDVGSTPINASGYGVLDMAGNVAEWVFDFYQDDFYLQNANAVNPDGPEFGQQRVLRGGSWNTPPFFTRTVHRQAFAPDSTFLWMGFRCADDVETQTTGQSGGVTPLDLGTDLTPQAEQPADDLGGAPTLPPRATAAGQATEVPAVPPDPGSGG